MWSGWDGCGWDGGGGRGHGAFLFVWFCLDVSLLPIPSHKLTKNLFLFKRRTGGMSEGQAAKGLWNCGPLTMKCVVNGAT